MFSTGLLASVYQKNPTAGGDDGRVITRFPPEPNGFLHLGHSKAIAVNFGFAKYHGGECNLRFDDTNPIGEEEKYFVAIEEMVRWLGFQPTRITYSSDNFDSLYELAEQLILRDGAYVCHCSPEEMLHARGGKKGDHPRYACTHRDRPITESLSEFRAMRNGKYEPRTAMLRMKQNLEDGNPQMWDLPAYRIPLPKVEAEKEPDLPEEKWLSHHRTGKKWKIYPTYDFTHCLVDSMEGITHSLCTAEFELSRMSYNWLCDKLEVYRPMQREFGRLSVAGTVLSKRKILALIANGSVRGWDDPRLYTLVALRRRGVPPGAILSFVSELGVTKATTTIEIKRFEQCVRRYLESTVPRLMLVLDPVPVIIDNFPEDYREMVEVPFSKDPNHGAHSVPFTRIVYIERSDFSEVPSKDFFRLAPGSSVGLLRVPFPIKATSFDKDAKTGQITTIHATYEKPEASFSFKKPKAYIHWVAECPQLKSPSRCRVHVYNALFKSDNPEAHPDGFLEDINPKSEEVFQDAMIGSGLGEIIRKAPWPAMEGERASKRSERPREAVRFQGVRVGYFCLDHDSTADDIILNRIVSLKEDTKKAR